MKKKDSAITKLEHSTLDHPVLPQELDKDLHQLIEYKKAVDQSTIISMTDKNGIITYVNEAFENVSGYSKDKLLGQPHNIIKNAGNSPDIYTNLWKTITDKKVWNGVIKNRAKNGRAYYVDTTITPILSKSGEIEKFIAVRHDITKIIEQEQLIHRQSTDNLTGLPNRFKLLQDLEKKHYKTLAIFDIDDFQEINKLYGHEIGDKIIKKVAIYLSEALQIELKQRQIYKLPGDKFVILSVELINESSCKEIIVTFLDKFSKNLFMVDKHEIYLNMSAGVSYGADSNILINANIALNDAKKNKLPFAFYSLTKEEEKYFFSNQKMIKTLKDAISKDWIIPYCQPIYDNKTLKITKYEVLMRIMNEKEEIITPSSFLDISHKTKVYSELTKIIIRKSFEMFQDKDIPFTINISIEDIRNPITKKYIIGMLIKFTRPHNVVFEIVESDEIANYTLIKQFVKEIKKYGADIAIDDFGSGYSNFIHLLELKPKFIKIDGSIVKNILHDYNSRILIQTIVSMANKLNMKVVAEFVTSKEIYDAVTQLNVDYSQGYYLGEPKPSLIKFEEKLMLPSIESTAKDIKKQYKTVLDFKEQYKIENKLISLGSIVENSLNEIFIFDSEDFHFTYVNKAGQQNLGYTMEELLRMTPIDIKPEHTLESFLEFYEPLKDDSVESLVFNARHQRKDGSEYIAEIRLQKLNQYGKKQYVVIAQDITERNKIEKIMFKERKQFEEAQKIAHLGSWEWNIENNDIIWSDEVFRIFGEETQSFTPTFERFLTYLSKDGQDGLKKALDDALDNKEPYKFNHEVYRKDGTIHYVQESGYIQCNDNNEAISMIGTVLDITERHHLEEKLKKMAIIDSLTGIYNRHKVDKVINIEIERAKRYGSTFACCMLDIDHFKSINDTYGHDVGDDVLIEFTTIISKEIRLTDCFGRWGGEEFIVILPELNNEEAVIVAEKLRKTVANHSFQGVSKVTMSCGVTTFNQDETKKSLLKKADTALYQAKKKGRNKVIFY